MTRYGSVKVIECLPVDIAGPEHPLSHLGRRGPLAPKRRVQVSCLVPDGALLAERKGPWQQTWELRRLEPTGPISENVAPPCNGGADATCIYILVGGLLCENHITISVRVPVVP
jgi:hypothetical protein